MSADVRDPRDGHGHGGGHGDGGGGEDAGRPADAERDAWLREALRHAPDSAAAPPPALREAILAQARAATRAASAPRASRARSGSGFWAWLARPPVASGFAGLMAATLVGLMWWDQPMDLAAPPPMPPAKSTPAAAPADAAAGPMAAAPATTSSPSVTTTPTPPAADALPAEAKKEADASSRRAPRATAQAFPRADPKAVANAAPRSEEHLARQDSRAAVDEAPTPAAPAHAETVTTAPASPQAAPLRERQGLATGAARSKAAPEAFSTPPPEGERATRRAPAQTASRDAAPPTRQTTGDASRPLDALLASVATDASRWSWRAAGGEARPLDDETRRWLADFDAATRGRWQGVPAGSATAAEASPAAAAVQSLVLLLDGRPAAVFRVDSAEAFHESRLEGSTRRSRAALAPAEAARLATTLPR